MASSKASLKLTLDIRPFVEQVERAVAVTEELTATLGKLGISAEDMPSAVKAVLALVPVKEESNDGAHD